MSRSLIETVSARQKARRDSVIRGFSEKGIAASQLLSSSEQGVFSLFRDDSQTKRRYSNFRGVVYSAVNAIASEGAAQSVQVGTARTRVKSPRRTKSLRMKTGSQTFEPVADHPLLKLLSKPNQLQHRYQFVYSFISNLCLTGWSYIILGEDDDGNPELYSLPTNWVKVDHSKGPFSQFRVVNPDSTDSREAGKPLTRDQVCFAYLPDPSNLFGAYAPANSQIPAIKIDEAIQSSQISFFDNGIFPSVIVTVGQQPHPDIPGGLRPRLSPSQRRQVYGAIKRASAGVANYGDPIIVDGLIEKVERLSATQNEMGWEKSEKVIRSRILSAFGVHPFILGEEVASSYAQSAVVDMRFGKKLNVFLDLLSTVVTEFAPKISEEFTDAVVKWDPYRPDDPGMRDAQWTAARQRGDVSQAEYRAYLGLAPDPDAQEAAFGPDVANIALTIAAQAKGGQIASEQAVAILQGLGIKADLAESIAGGTVSDEEALSGLETAVDEFSSLTNDSSMEDSSNSEFEV